MINSDVLKMELRRSMKALIVWSVSLGIYTYLVFILYPMVKDIYALFPEEYMEYLNSVGGVPTNIVEYFATEGGMFLQIFGAIFAAITGFSSLNREERGQTTDLIYTLPLSRKSFYNTKLLSVFIQVIVFSVINFIFIIIGLISVSSISFIGDLIIFTLLYTLMLVIIAIIGFALATITSGNSKSTISLLIPFPLYIFYLIATLSKNEYLEYLKYISPFTFSDPISLLKSDVNIEFISLGVFIFISVILLFLSKQAFNKKEFNF